MSAEKANGEGPRKLKILMLHEEVTFAAKIIAANTSLSRLSSHFLHSPSTQIDQDQSSKESQSFFLIFFPGFTQSGPLFHAKTRALEKILTKAFPALSPAPHNRKASPGNLLSYPGGIQLIYPTAPIRLQPADIPGFSASEQSESEKEDPDAWGWWKKDSSTGHYIGLDEGLETIRKAIEEVGGIDGVIGFSQGGAMAAMLAALLEDGRESHFLPSSPLPYPPSYLSLRSTLPQQPLRFAVSYSGFYAQPELYKPFYEPKIKTRFLHVIGSLDSVVEEDRSQGLVERCEEEVRTKVVHPGGHFVPVGREYAGVLVGWLRDVLSEKKVDEESVEDMDMPF
ncbi:related to dihydrofolate reductase [Rhynchosporium secalis]|uniref:Related to dihydrofolate reductase n=1 Tax=Rhynchosporium secalis TaxID=38038 RepID=A0A1E1MCR2_RHYSE|nr:related to dihydrofolate reductase [Rhynchosporium secalis]